MADDGAKELNGPMKAAIFLLSMGEGRAADIFKKLNDEEIRQVAKQYGVVFIKDQQEQDYLFTHSDYIYLLDDQGRVRKLYPADFTIDEVVNDAKSLL